MRSRCWKVDHGAEHAVHPIPAASFSGHDCSLVHKLSRNRQRPECTLPNDVRKDRIFSNGQIDANKFRDKVRIFFWIYFVMTGLHALHMIVGLGLMTWLLWKAWKGHL